MAETKKGKQDEKLHRLYRSETNRVIAGVAGGLGEFFDVDPTIIRILFVILTVFGGSGFIIYIVLWLMMPLKSDLNKSSQDSIKSNIDDLKKQTTTFAHSISVPGTTKENSRFWWAMIIIVVGFFLLLNNFGLLGAFDLHRLWPLILIVFGLAIILRK